MYRFALRPRWLLGHVVVLGLVALLVSLGLWQLRRLDERQDANAAIAARAAAPVRTVLGPDEEPDEVERRRFRLEGRFDTQREILVRGRLRNGLPGYEVLTPLMLSETHAVVVNRGWIPQQVGDSWPRPELAPPAGTTTVTGLARPSERSALKPSTGSGDVPVVSAVRLDELAALHGSAPYTLAPVWLVAADGASTGELPAALPPPDLSDGPHLSYAMQWFLFSAIAAVGWVLLVRQSAKRRLRS